MGRINFEIINLPYEEIKGVKHAYIELGEDTLIHLVEYKSCELEEHEDDPLLNSWTEEMYNYRKCTIKKDQISVVELRTTTPIEDHQNWCLAISGSTFNVQTFFEINNLRKAKEVEAEILQWLGWK